MARVGRTFGLAATVARRVGAPRSSETHFGKVTAVNTTAKTVTVALYGGTLTCGYASTYTPSAGDNVRLELLGTNDRARSQWIAVHAVTS